MSFHTEVVLRSLMGSEVEAGSEEAGSEEGAGGESGRRGGVRAQIKDLTVLPQQHWGLGGENEWEGEQRLMSGE